MKLNFLSILVSSALIMSALVHLLFFNWNEFYSGYLIVFFIFFLISSYSSFWLIFFIGLRPFKTISPEVKIINKLANRFGLKISKVFLAPLFPTSIFLLDSYLGHPQIIIGTSIAKELTSDELECLVENLILEVKTERPLIRTLLLSYVLIFTLPFAACSLISDSMLKRKSSLVENLIKFFSFPIFMIGKKITAKLNTGSEINKILPKLEKISAENKFTQPTLLLELLNFCKIEKVNLSS